ncbi:MAG: EFR1 family ferrodoxin [Bacteroides sp.]|nr:EFR1 family ferrodoxin [Bacteroides sp.]MCM1085184.1 EFR1 family ferrodoxin [Bacteroides sp.]
MKAVKAVYFSATGTTKKVVCTIAAKIAAELKLPCTQVDFTLPSARVQPLVFEKGDIVVMGTPVYAGRVPNVLLKYLQAMQGVGAVGVPVVMFGNRNYDDALIELRDLMESAGIRTVGAGAFVGEHAFSRVLGANRPDRQDLLRVEEFAVAVAKKIAGFGENALPEAPVFVEGTPFPYRGYYQPRDRHGVAINILKVKSLVNDRCTGCKICADVCPMGSISRENVREYTGICIKCGACIKKCPENARYYNDEGYLYHQHELEEIYARRGEPCWFV